MRSARTYAIPLALISSACSIQARCGLEHCLPNAGDAMPSEDTSGSSRAGGDTKVARMISVPVAVERGRPMARSFVAKIAAGASCPAAPVGWVLQPAPVIASTRMTALMARYCAYELEPGAVVPAVMPALDAPAGVIESVAADYAQVLPQPSPQAPPQALVLGTGAGHHARLREQLGATFKDGASNVDDTMRPYVAIIDTAEPAVAWPGKPREQHGLVMGGIVSTIRCPADDASCDRERILYAQAFPSSLSSTGDDVEARGSVWSLNLAVLEALERWRSLSNGKVPLVLNMSVGWEWSSEDSLVLRSRRGDLLSGKGLEGLEGGEVLEGGEGLEGGEVLEGLEGGAFPSLSPAEEALFLTLSWASCQQVLAIAAAGNTRGGACAQTGPMAPAAWESVKRLDWSECRDLLDPADHAGMSLEPEHRPNALVYAAGGVDADDQPIVNARPGSEPKRVLYASMASVPTPAGGHTAPWTGTSVAAASLSAIAAQYWGLGTNHALRPAEVMAAIDGQATPIDLGYASGAFVPRVRAYDVLPKLYEQSSLLLVSPDDTDESSGAPNRPLMTLESNPTDDRTCNGRSVKAFSFAGAAAPVGVAWPELTAQPDSPICPLCPLKISSSPASLKIAVNTTAYPLTIGTTAVLELHLPGGQVTQIALDLRNQCTQLSCMLWLDDYSHPNGTIDKTLSDYVKGANVGSARMSFYVPTSTIGNQLGGTQLVGNEIPIFRN